MGVCIVPLTESEENDTKTGQESPSLPFVNHFGESMAIGSEQSDYISSETSERDRMFKQTAIVSSSSSAFNTGHTATGGSSVKTRNADTQSRPRSASNAPESRTRHHTPLNKIFDEHRLESAAQAKSVESSSFPHHEQRHSSGHVGASDNSLGKETLKSGSRSVCFNLTSP